MTPEAQRIAIALARGWTKRLVPSAPNGPKNPYGEFQHTWWTNPGGVESGAPPDYPSDLNAMREVIDHMNRTQPDGWNDEHFLLTLCGWTKGLPHHATAAQWAEALLRTLGQWVE